MGSVLFYAHRGHAIPVQNPLQVLSSVRIVQLRDGFRWPERRCSHRDRRLRAQVDHPIRRLDDFQIVLDDNNRASRINETAESGKQFADIVEVQPVVGSSKM